MKLKHLLYMTLLPLSFSQAMAKENQWENNIYAEKDKYSFVSTVSKEVNSMSYYCSVFKLGDANFGKAESLKLELDLKLEEDKLAFQDYYDINFVFSNGKLFKNNLKLNTSRNGLDSFTLFLDSKNDKTDKDLLKNFSNRSYVNVEIHDKNKKRVLYRYYLKNSLKSIKKTQLDCEILHNTFK